LVALSLSGLGCTGSKDNPDEHPYSESNKEVEGDDSQKDGLPIPLSGGDDECDEEPPWTLCEWVTRYDALVWGRVFDFRLATDELILSDGTAVDSCDGSIRPTAKMEIAVEEILYGTAPDELRAHVGVDALMDWTPLPSFGEDGLGVRWSPHTAAVPLQDGSRIGVALQYVDDKDIWVSVSMFAEQQAGEFVEVVLQSDYCGRLILNETARHLDGFEAGVRNCKVTAEAEEFRDWSQRGYSRYPQASTAAVCHPTPTPTRDDCEVAEDCFVNGGTNWECVHNSCMMY
jgi:hypothetical protein